MMCWHNVLRGLVFWFHEGHLTNGAAGAVRPQLKVILCSYREAEESSSDQFEILKSWNFILAANDAANDDGGFHKY